MYLLYPLTKTPFIFNGFSKGTLIGTTGYKGTSKVVPKGDGNMIEQAFNVNMAINEHNLNMILDVLKQKISESKFLNADMNKTFLCLHYMKQKITKTEKKSMTKCTLAPVKKNKRFPELTERFVHSSVFDPCNSAYTRPIRHLLLEGTPIAEVDITATVVYIFAKMITNDPYLLRCYAERDFYSLLPSKTRDEQKKLTQVWLQGWFDQKIVYNELFPVTSEYLQKTAIKENGVYARNSGLFRELEVKALDKMLSGDVHIINHLHDGYYIHPRNIKKCVKLVKDVWGDEVKFKVKDYSKIEQKSYSEIHEIISGIEWESSEGQNIDLRRPPKFMLGQKQGIFNDPYANACGFLLDNRGNCIYDDNGEVVEVQKSFVVQELCKQII